MMTGDDKAGKAAEKKERRVRQAEYLTLLRGQHFGPEQEADPTPHNQAVVALCDLLLGYTERRAKGTPTPSFDDQLVKLVGARDTLECYFPTPLDKTGPLARAPLARLLSATGSKIRVLRDHIQKREAQSKGKRIHASMALAAATAELLHGGCRADSVTVMVVEQTVIRPRPKLGQDDEWNAKRPARAAVG
jgi:hypothetical protein